MGQGKVGVGNGGQRKKRLIGHEESISKGEYDSDTNTCMPTANTEREREDNSELDAQVDEIMQTVFGDDDSYIYGDSEDD